MTCMFITSFRKIMCKIKKAWEDEDAFRIEIRGFNRTYSWVSSDPEGKHHTRGLIMRQGLTTPLITKGLRRTRRLFEADIIKIPMAEAISNVELRGVFSGNSEFYSILKCMSDTIQSNQRRETYRSNPWELQIHSLTVCYIVHLCIYCLDFRSHGCSSLHRKSERTPYQNMLLQAVHWFPVLSE